MDHSCPQPDMVMNLFIKTHVHDDNEYDPLPPRAALDGYGGEQQLGHLHKLIPL